MMVSDLKVREGAGGSDHIITSTVRRLNLTTSYTGFIYDQVLNIYFAQARMYDPSIRRFMAVDPVRGNIFNPQLMVAYTFVLNNPLRWVDPLGLSPLTTDEIERLARDLGGAVSWRDDVMTISGNNDSARFNYGDFYNANRLDFLLRDLLGDMCDDEWHDFVDSGGTAAVLRALFDARNIHEELASIDSMRQAGAQKLARDNVNGMRAPNINLIIPTPFGMPNVVLSPEISAAIISALGNSIDIELSYGVGLGAQGRVGPVRGNLTAAGMQTHSWNLGTGSYQQRNHLVAELGVDLLDNLGLQASISSGFTYNDGFVMENGRIVPTTEWTLGAYAGSGVLGWTNDGRDSDFRIGIGAGAFLVVGGAFDVSFNLSEFGRQLSGSYNSQPVGAGSVKINNITSNNPRPQGSGSGGSHHDLMSIPQ